jgi:hypothetical protein
MIRRRTRPGPLPIARLVHASREQCFRRRGQPFDPIERHPDIGRIAQQHVFGNEPAHHPRDRVLRDPHRHRRNRYPLLHRNPHNHIMTAGCDNYARDRAVGFGPRPTASDRGLRDGRGRSRQRSRRSARRAACRPHMPCTPPPGGVDDEHRYRPRTGVAHGCSETRGRMKNCRRSVTPPLMSPPT